MSFALFTRSISAPSPRSFPSKSSYPRRMYTISSTTVTPSAARPAITSAAPARRSGAETSAPVNFSAVDDRRVAFFSGYTCQLIRIFKTMFYNTRTVCQRQCNLRDLRLHIGRISRIRLCLYVCSAQTFACAHTDGIVKLFYVAPISSSFAIDALESRFNQHIALCGCCCKHIHLDHIR